MKKVKSALVLLLMTCLFLTAKTESKSKTPTAKLRTDLHMGMSAEPTSMDPSRSKDLITWIFIMQSYDTLIKYNIETKEFIPALASAWEVNEDSTEVLFTIRDDIKFQNGDKMTIDDVLFSLNRALKSTFTDQIDGSIDHFEKVGNNQIKLVQKYGYAPILEVMVTPCWGIVNQKYIEEHEAKGEDVGRIQSNGTGAYTMTGWKSGEKLVFKAFEDYYEGAPAIKDIDCILIADQTSGALALEQGALDYYYGAQNSDIQHLKDVPTLKVYENLDGAGIYDITFNVTDGVFANKKLRQAVAYALDREEILLGGQEGRGIVTNTICASGAFGYMPDYQWYSQDKEKAKALVVEAGYPNGVNVVFTQDSSRTYMASAEIMQAQLKEIGINVTFDKLERATWLDIVASQRKYTASLRMTNHVVMDADYILTRRLTTGMIGGGNNYANYSNPEFDKLVEQARTEPDRNKRLEIYKKCYDIIKEDVPFIPIYTTNNYQVVNAKIGGWISHPTYRTPWSKLYYTE
ncbi:MAG: ABC transporter substrate-binding protein [Fusobacteriaceae bacterium]|jgi:peptide/nickel transport system substrate-binding protein|nr:ABC transporter substrate-binding protein [Fusobacteriaceae bacterium]